MSNSKTKSSFIPYGRQTIDNDDIKAVVKVLKSDWLTQGPAVKQFEEELAKYCNAKYAVAVSSGTAALHLAYLAVGLKNGDEVITTPNTFAATANMLLVIGAKPIFCDIRLNNYNIDETKIEKLITPKTRAIIPVHFGGHPCKMDKILSIAKKYNLLVIEDACHALGASYKNRKIGGIGDISVFSFHPVKSITTGEGGAILTNNSDFYTKLVHLRTHGITKDKNGFNVMTALGYNYRITDIQTALGISQMKKLDKFVKARQLIFNAYKKELASMKEITMPEIAGGSVPSNHLFVILTKDPAKRDPLANFLKQNGIGINFHYPAVYSHPYYRANGYKEVKLANADLYHTSCITLPIYTTLKTTQIKYICNKVKEFFKNEKRIKAVIFDWGGVFAHPDNPLLHTKLRQDPQFKNGFVNHKTKDLSKEYYSGTLASSDYWKKYVEILDINELSPDQARNYYLDYTLDKKMFGLLKKISKKYPTALLSNLNVDMKNKILRDLDLNKYFKHMIFSNDVGVLKPDPSIYRIAIEKLQLEPNSILFIDDSLENIECAQKMGLKTILFTSAKQCKSELEKMGII